MEILYFIIGAACVFLLQRLLYQKYWNKRLSVSVRFSQHAITEQEEGELLETICNQKWLPLPMLRVKFEADRHLDFQQEGNLSVTDRCYKNDIFTAMMWQKITRRLKFVGRRRGFYTIQQLAVDSTDLFMEKHLGMDCPCDTWLYVYPGQADARRLLIPFRKMMGDILTRTYTYEDPFEFQGIRPYQPFDSMRDVNWKASARTGELRTNVHGHTVRQEVCLLLNLKPESMMEYRQLQEESIRIVNSLAGMFLAQGIPVGIYSNAKDLLSQKELVLPSGGDRQHLNRVRENLSRLDLSLEMEDFGDFFECCKARQQGQTLYVLVSASQRDDVTQLYAALAGQSPGSQWILPLHPWMEQKIQAVKNSAIVRWEVVQNASG